MNNIYYDYIGAKGSYEINDYVDSEIIITSNILNNKIDLTSNILETHIIESSNNNIQYTNNLRTDINKLINEETKTILNINYKHTYIYNSNILGEIRFVTQGTPKYALNDDNNYTIKIQENGQLYIYYNYDFGYPTVLGGWYNVMDALRDGYAYQATNGALLGEIQFKINGLSSQIIGIESALGTLAENVQLLNGTTVEGLNEIIRDATQLNIGAVFNNASIFGLSLAGVLGILCSISASIMYNQYIRSQINELEKLNNSNISPAQSNIFVNQLKDAGTSNISSLNYNLSNLNILNGFINTNITTPQLIPKITTNEITYNGVEISTTLNNYVLKAGGTMSGRLNFNYGANFGTPVGGGGGSGERINLNTNGITISDFPPSLGVSGNSLWFSSPANHSYQWFNNGNQLMSLTSSGQLILNNPITTAERQYPPKAYTSSTNESVITFLGQSGMLSSTITLNPIGITYGSGVYEIYSSSRYNASEYQKRDLFNYATTTNEVGGHWASGQYTQTGLYNGAAYIKPDYLGDFLVVKLPNPIILTKFRFYPRLGLNFRIPGEFKFYGSMNNIDYTEITQASQITPRLTTNDIINGYYEKTLAAGFNTPYLYIGFAVNKLMGTYFPDCINFQEFQIYGKEVLSSTASLAIGTSDASTYALNVNGVVNASSYIGIGSSLTTLDYNNITLNKPLVFPPDPTAVQTTILTSTPNVNKKSGFLIYVNNPVYPNGGNTLYYSYDIYLPSYVSQAIVESSTDPYRNFHIRLSYASSYYEYLKNGLPNCLSYEIFMSDKANPGSSGIGKQNLNICALGTPENYYLDKVMPNDLFLMRSPFAYFDRICVLSTRIADVRVIIEDLLN